MVSPKLRNKRFHAEGRWYHTETQIHNKKIRSSREIPKEAKLTLPNCSKNNFLKKEPAEILLKGWVVNILESQAKWALLQILKSAAVMWKYP